MMNKIAAALVKARRSFGPALKDKNNPAFRSKYADLGACIEAVDDALLEQGIALAQETSEDSTGVTVETVLIHESGETMRFGKLHVPAAKQDPQGYGSALTYCRRYSLMAACGIAPEDDDGNAASKPRAAPAQAPAPAKTGVAADVLAMSPMTAEQKDALTNLAIQVQGDFDAYGAAAAFERIEEQGLDNTEKIYLSTMLSSAARNQIKAHSLAVRGAKSAA